VYSSSLCHGLVLTLKKGVSEEENGDGSANNTLRCEVAFKIREKLQPQSELGLYIVIVKATMTCNLPSARLVFNN